MNETNTKQTNKKWWTTFFVCVKKKTNKQTILKLLLSNQNEMDEKLNKEMKINN